MSSARRPAVSTLYAYGIAAEIHLSPVTHVTRPRASEELMTTCAEQTTCPDESARGVHPRTPGDRIAVGASRRPAWLGGLIGPGADAAIPRGLFMFGVVEELPVSAGIVDVARRAGVSVATVSRALRGLPDVAPSTRVRVLRAARELDYAASPHAARLASGRSGTVAVVVPFINRWFFAEVLAAVEAVLGAAQLDLLLYQLGGVTGRDRFFAELPVRKRIDALLVVSLVLTDRERDAVASLGVPIGVLGVDHAGFHSTGIDDRTGAATAVTHLIESGHHRIAHVGGDLADPMRFSPPRQRRLGYLDALGAAGLGYDPGLDAVGYYTSAGAQAATEHLLAGSKPFSALFAESDEMAYGALRAIRRSGLNIPRDVAVIGFDDQASAALLDLSTMHQPVAEQARDLSTRILAATAGQVEAPTARILPTQLVVRGSTDPRHSTY